MNIQVKPFTHRTSSLMEIEFRYNGRDVRNLSNFVRKNSETRYQKQETRDGLPSAVLLVSFAAYLLYNAVRTHTEFSSIVIGHLFDLRYCFDRNQAGKLRCEEESACVAAIEIPVPGVDVGEELTPWKSIACGEAQSRRVPGASPLSQAIRIF